MDKKTKLIEFDYTDFYFKKIFQKYPKIYKPFLEFLQHQKSQKLNKDQWTSFFDLVVTLEDFPTGYSLNDSWPLLFDDFYVDYCKKNNIEIPKQEDDPFNY